MGESVEAGDVAASCWADWASAPSAVSDAQATLKGIAVPSRNRAENFNEEGLG